MIECGQMSCSQSAGLHLRKDINIKVLRLKECTSFTGPYMYAYLVALGG